MMARRRNDFTINDVLVALDGNESDFSQGGFTDDSDDDEMYVPDTSCNLEEETDFENEPANEKENDGDGDSSNDDDDDEDGADCQSDDGSDDNIPLATRLGNRKKNNVHYRWKKKGFEQPTDHFLGETVTATDPTGLSETPMQYFKRFITDEMLELIVEHTNRYSIQKHGKCANTSLKEIEQLLGLYYKMGLVEMPSCKMYWENGTRYSAVADVMSRNRFKLLLGTIHFVDNEIVSDEEKKNRLWKIHPFLQMFRLQCLRVTPVQHQSIDEMMIPYKGKFGKIRQYVKGKPHPWGFKVWCRCSPIGFLHDFEVYQGKVEGVKKNAFGVGGGAVLKMCETLQKHAFYKIYAHNYFTSIKLVEKLSSDRFFYAGTVKRNCLGKALNSKLLTEKKLRQSGRGSYDVRVESNRNIICLRWLDTKAVTMLSNYAGTEPLDKARRWDRNKKEYIQVDRPYLIKEYNSNMGGVDMLDSHISKCKLALRSRRWYMILFWHFVSLGVINAWLLYRRDCELLKITGNGVLKLREFQALVAQGLTDVGTRRKRGRPSDEENAPKTPKVVRVEPCQDVRYDQVGHWPEKKEKRRRCAVCKTIKTDTYCEKCSIPLCFNERRNCYKTYHVK